MSTLTDRLTPEEERADEIDRIVQLIDDGEMDVLTGACDLRDLDCSDEFIQHVVGPNHWDNILIAWSRGHK